MAYSKVQLETVAMFDGSEYEMFATEVCCKSILKYRYNHSESDQDVQLSAVHVPLHVVNVS
jgi:hypothetical protein